MRRFPADFMFQLTLKEFSNLRSQIVTSSWGGTRYRPMAFTELGISMLSSILNTEKAIKANIAIMRAFVKFRDMEAKYTELNERISKFEKKHKKDVNGIGKTLDYLTIKIAGDEMLDNRPRIGFK